MLDRNDPRQLKFCRRKLALASGNPFFSSVVFHLALVFNPRTHNWFRTLSLSLKIAGLLLLLLCLLEPMWTTTRPREGANLFAVVADNSMGLQRQRQRRNSHPRRNFAP